MQLENIASPPPNQTPQIRYACLHRTIERGLANDSTWIELTRVCVSLQLRDEALRAFDQIESPGQKVALNQLLIRSGIKEPDVEGGPNAPTVLEYHEERAIVKDHLRDATHFLFQGQMPLIVVLATLSFPLVVGVGGVMTRGSSMFLLPLIAFLPGMSVLAILGGMGRRILLEAAQGLEEPPQMPSFGTLARESSRFTGDTLALMAVFFAPVLGMLLLGAPFGACAIAMLAAAALLPMAMILRQLRGDWKALEPRTLMTAVRRGGRTYLSLASIISALFLPAALAGWASFGASLYLQVSVLGPLAVLPIFVVSRILGTFVHENRAALGDVLEAPPTPLAETAEVVRVARTPEVASPVGAPSAAPKQAQAAPRQAAGRPAASTLRQKTAQAHQQRRQAAAAQQQVHPEAQRVAQRADQPKARPAERRAAPPRQTVAAGTQAGRPQAASMAQGATQRRATPQGAVSRGTSPQAARPLAKAGRRQPSAANRGAPTRAPQGTGSRPAPARGGPSSARPAPARPAPARPAASPARASRPAAPQATGHQPVVDVQWTNHPQNTDQPEMAKLPGFQILTGEARARRAASRRP